MLPTKAIEEFKVLYKKHYGLDISDQEASRRANNLVNLYKIIYSPVAPAKEGEQKLNQTYDILFEDVVSKSKNRG